MGNDLAGQCVDQVGGLLAGRGDAVQPGYLAAEKGGSLDEAHFESPIGDILGRTQAGDAAADDRGVLGGIHTDRFQGVELLRLCGGCGHQSGGLVRGPIPVVDPAYLFADVGVFVDEM